MLLNVAFQYDVEIWNNILYDTTGLLPMDKFCAINNYLTELLNFNVRRFTAMSWTLSFNMKRTLQSDK